MSRSRIALASLALVLLAAFGLLVGFPGAFRSQDQAVDLLVKRTMKAWAIPGMAVAVVHADRVVYLKGFGVRALGAAAPVTADTVFPIASCTKSFTTLAMGMLVDDGKLSWDDPVRKHLPDFHLADPHADALVTLRDLVTHRTGVGTHDLLWYYSPFSLPERVHRAGRLELVRPFRAGFQYQVVLFGAAGLAAGNAAGNASGGTWQGLVTQRILGPLEMTDTTCAFPADAPPADLASPHRREPGGRVVAAPRYPLTEPDPAGSIHSTARDLARYLRFQLGDGTSEDKRLISAAGLAEPQTPQVVLRLDGGARAMNPETLFLDYGMGWVVQDYRGKRLVMHGGAIDGFRAHLTLVPDAGLGVALLTNLGGGIANLALSNSLVDLFLGLPTRDWNAYYRAQFDEAEQGERSAAQARRDRRGPDAGPPRPLASYAGVYHDAVYGDCRIEVDGGALVWSWGGVRCRLEHDVGETFLATVGPLDDAPFVFTPGPDGTTTALHALDRVFRHQPAEH